MCASIVQSAYNCSEYLYIQRNLTWSIAWIDTCKSPDTVWSLFVLYPPTWLFHPCTKLAHEHVSSQCICMYSIVRSLYTSLCYTYMCDAICSIFSAHYLFLGKCLVSVQFPLPQSSIRWPVQGTGLIVKSHAFPGVSHHTLAPLVQLHQPHLYWMFQREEILHVMNVYGTQLCSTCIYINFVHNGDTGVIIVLFPPSHLPFFPRLSHYHIQTACTCTVHIIVHHLCWVPVLPTLREQGAMVDLSGSVCLVKPPTHTPPWSNMQCHHPPLIVGMLPWPVQQAASPLRNTNEGYVVNMIWCVIWESCHCVCRISDSSAAVIIDSIVVLLCRVVE